MDLKKQLGTEPSKQKFVLKTAKVNNFAINYSYLYRVHMEPKKTGIPGKIAVFSTVQGKPGKLREFFWYQEHSGKTHIIFFISAVILWDINSYS